MLRFSTLGVQSEWFDEVLTTNDVSGSLGHLFDSLGAVESTPPLYFLLTWLWAHVFGDSAVALRGFSALVGTATVPLAWALARRVSERCGLWAAALTAVNPLLFYYAQEARSYALFIFLAGLATLLWLRAVDTPRPGRVTAWAGVAVLALLTHYFAVFLVAPQGAWLLWRTRAALPVVAAVVCFGLVGASLLPLLSTQRADHRQDWIQDRALTTRIAEVPKQFVVGIDGPAEKGTAALSLLLVAAALLLLHRRARPEERRMALVLGALCAVTLGIPLALSVSGAIDVLSGRNAVAALLPAIALIGVALGARGANRAGTAIGAALLAIGAVVIGGVLSDPVYQREDWRGVSEILREPVADRVVVSDLQGVVIFAHYLDGREIKGPVVQAKEIAFVVPDDVKAGSFTSAVPSAFAPAGVTRATEFSVHRFRAARETPVGRAELQRALPDAVRLFGQTR